MTMETAYTFLDAAGNSWQIPYDRLAVGVDANGRAAPFRLDANGNMQVAQASAGYFASVSIQRPNDTAAYAAGDVIGADTATTAAVEFTNVGPSGKPVMIIGTEFEVDAAALLSGEGSYTLRLYSATPPSAYGDNVAWDLPSGDRASFLGSVPLGTPIDLGSTLYVRQNGLAIPVKLAGTSLFAYLTTDGAFTPAAQTIRKAKIFTLPI